MNYHEKYKGDVLNDALAVELFDLIGYNQQIIKSFKLKCDLITTGTFSLKMIYNRIGINCQKYRFQFSIIAFNL